MRRVARSSLLLAAALALAIGVPSPGVGQSPSVPATPAGGSAVGVRLEYRIIPTDDQAVTPEILAQTRTIIENRVNATGVAEANVQTQGGDRITVELPGVIDVDEVRRLVSATGQLDFVGVPDEYANAIVEGEPLHEGMDPTPIFSGDQISAARPGTDNVGQLAVDIELKGQGAKLFDEYAAAHHGERFAIVLDGIVLVAPTINATSFDGRAEISGSFTSDEMNNLLVILKFGRLPLAVEEVSTGSGEPPPDASPVAVQATPAPSPSASPGG